MNEHIINIDKEKCIGCGMCCKDCVASNIVIENSKAEVHQNNCLQCGHCVAVCPKEAITISNYPTLPISKNNEVRLNPQEVLDVIRFRRSVRHFQDKPIHKEIIKQIIEAGRFTHTAKNMQDVSYVVLDKQKDAIEAMAVSLFRKMKPIANLTSELARKNEISDHFFFFQAPIVIAVVAKSDINGALASQNMEFVAEANGLGVLYSGYFSKAANVSRKITKALQIPKGKKVMATLVIGYPDIKYYRSVQRKQAEVIYL